VNIAEQAVAEGIVLLENEGNTLPLKASDKLALVGNGCFNYVRGGTGSAQVFCEYESDLVAGIKKRGINVLEASLTESVCYDLKLLNEYAKQSTCALMMFTRITGEAMDNKVQDFCLYDHEKKLLEALDASEFEKAIVLINSGTIIDVNSIREHKKVKAIMCIWLPGMEGGSAVAGALCGDFSPSGRLTDTMAYSYVDYPSANYFDQSDEIVYYPENVFVGYRYFETYAKRKVLYPFGYGLSYTDFTYKVKNFAVNDSEIKIEVIVKNTGSIAGKDVVQVYSSPPLGRIKKPKRELRAFAKTELLAPGQEQTLCLCFNICDMAYFCEERAAYAMDKGEYEIFVGENVREITLCGKYIAPEDMILKQLSLKFSGGLPYQLNENGEFESTSVYNPIYGKEKNADVFTAGDENNIIAQTLVEEDNEHSEYTLYDVSEQRISLDEFISNLTYKQMIELSQAQPPAFPQGTAGIGNMIELGIPNPQTADGPAGVRRSKPTTCFPCATLLACTWNMDLLYRIGEEIGEEAIKNGVDIMLAPGLNIHRNPLCGRNFEYYSEDPLISGKCAAAMVNGIQSKDVGATIKHFALNNKEVNRRWSNSVVSERAIREIYLKGFEIAIKESSPWCVMTSYNKINGTYAAENYNLLTGVLRGEWKYEGLVMTDWRAQSHLWQEILAGNNMKMPFGYPDEIELAMEAYKQKRLSRAALEKNVRYILETVMKTRSFIEKNFGAVHNIDSGKTINALGVAELSATCISSGYFESGEECLVKLGLDQRGNDEFIGYLVENKTRGMYRLSVNVACAYEGVELEVCIDGSSLFQIECTPDICRLDTPSVVESEAFEISEGLHKVILYIRNAQDPDCVRIGNISFVKLNCEE